MVDNAFTDLLTNRYFVAVGVPGLLIAIGAVAKKIVRGPGWVRQDFFLGVDLALASLSAALIHVYEVIGRWSADVAVPGRGAAERELLAAMTFLTFCLLAFLLVVALHQDQEQKPRTGKRQLFWLGVVTNVFAGGLLTAFILFIKGVQP
ncbi:MAG TPA: hypothetical protein VFQ45_15440 [Longimicrobium sp.]|nr:hypothetical protein [Longimicrobium sp.]